jgi:hypothetical protein
MFHSKLQSTWATNTKKAILTNLQTKVHGGDDRMEKDSLGVHDTHYKHK